MPTPARGGRGAATAAAIGVSTASPEHLVELVGVIHAQRQVQALAQHRGAGAHSDQKDEEGDRLGRRRKAPCRTRKEACKTPGTQDPHLGAETHSAITSL